MMRWIRVMPIVAMLLSGCAAPVSNSRVEPISAAALSLGNAAAPALPPAWWTGFGDPQLDRIIGDALAGNPGLDVALARLAQAQAGLDTQRAADGPAVNFDAQAQIARLSGRYTIPPPYAGSTRFIGTAVVGLGWNLDLFGRQKAAIRAAAATRAAAAIDVAAARLALAGAVAQAYIDLARAEAGAAVAGRTVATRANSLRLIDIRIRNQLASQLDGQAAITLLAQARQAVVRADLARLLAHNGLAALVGKGRDYADAIGPTAIDLDAGLALPAVIPADLLARRADIAAAQARIGAATQGRDAARKAFYPDVNLSAMAGLQGLGLGNFLSTAAGTAGFGPALHLPIFDNGRLRAGLRGATAALDLANAEYNIRVVGAAREAADAIARINAIVADRQRQREIVAGLAETGRLNLIRVGSGLESRLGLVDNDARLLDAELAATNLAADAARQRVALALALGGGFDPGSTP
jgi:NodT family efflux transporter outer membrane factor (OMF) lipoprotein